MDHYEVRKYPGWHHHMLTTMLAHFFLGHLDPAVIPSCTVTMSRRCQPAGPAKVIQIDALVRTQAVPPQPATLALPEAVATGHPLRRSPLLRDMSRPRWLLSALLWADPARALRRAGRKRLWISSTFAATSVFRVRHAP